MRTIMLAGLACLASSLNRALQQQAAEESKYSDIEIALFWPVWHEDNMPTSVRQYGTYKIFPDRVTLSYSKNVAERNRSNIQELKLPTSCTFPHPLDVDHSWIYIWVGPMFPYFDPHFPKRLSLESSWSLHHEVEIYHELLTTPFEAFGNISHNNLKSLLAYIHQPQLDFLAACKRLHLNILAVEPNRPLPPIGGDVDQRVYDYVIENDRKWVKAKLSAMGIPFCELPAKLITAQGYTPSLFIRDHEDKIHVKSKFMRIMAEKVLRCIWANF